MAMNVGQADEDEVVSAINTTPLVTSCSFC
jgi:hypothetical protein